MLFLVVIVVVASFDDYDETKLNKAQTLFGKIFFKNLLKAKNKAKKEKKQECNSNKIYTLYTLV